MEAAQIGPFVERRNMNQNVWKVFWAVIGLMAVLFLAGCGGGGTSSPTGSGLPPFIAGSVTEPDRTRAISEVTEFYKTVAGQTDAVQQVINFMKTKPEFVTAEKSKSGDAIGWFKDGVMHAVLDPVPLRAAARGRGDTVATAPTKGATSKKTRSLPGANAAYLIDVPGSRSSSIVSTIDPNLTARGYDTVVLEGAVGDFAQVQNAGVLYLQTISSTSRDKNGDERTWYVTATPNTEGNRALYRVEFEVGEMSVCTVEVESDGEERVYAERLMVSDRFLANSGMSFSSRGIWINDVENGAQPLAVESALRFDGLISYWSWSGQFYQEDASETSRFVFARFLGTPVSETDDLPPYKAGEVQSVIGTTARLEGSGNINKSPVDATSTFLGYSSNLDGTADLTMIPSIRAVILDKTENKMEIEGFFGSESGAITIDGSTLNLLQWTPTKVTVEAPSATKGAIVLRSLGGASASGQLLSKRFEWEDLAFEIDPAEIALSKNESTTFTVQAVTGRLPSGATFKWTLDGEGTINGSTTVNGSATSVTYQAPNAEGETILSVEVFSAGGSKLGVAYARINYGDNRISYTASGVTNYPNLNGEHAYADGRGDLFKSATLDEYQFNYNWDNVNDFPRVVIGLNVPKNTVLAAGQTYEWQSGVDVGYYFGTTQSLTDPTLDGNILLYGFQGSLTITSATTNLNGSQTIAYTFQILNGVEVKTSGSGTIVVTSANP